MSKLILCAPCSYCYYNFQNCFIFCDYLYEMILNCLVQPCQILLFIFKLWMVIILRYANLDKTRKAEMNCYDTAKSLNNHYKPHSHEEHMPCVRCTVAMEQHTISVCLDTCGGESRICCQTSFNLVLQSISYAILVNVKIFLELHFYKSILNWGFSHSY